MSSIVPSTALCSARVIGGLHISAADCRCDAGAKASVRRIANRSTISLSLCRNSVPARPVSTGARLLHTNAPHCTDLLIAARALRTVSRRVGYLTLHTTSVLCTCMHVYACVAGSRDDAALLPE